MGTKHLVIVEFEYYRQEGLVARIYRVERARDIGDLEWIVENLPETAASEDYQSYDGREQGELEAQLSSIFEDMAANVTLEDLGIET
jgi:hypothetical protein